MSQPINLPLAAFGGAGIGLLFGVIMGTSVTPTVATMLGALTALLAGILGLNDNMFNDAKAARVGAFGVACVVGAYMGLYVRSHNVLAPSMLDLKQDYLDVGFTEKQALNFIAMKEFGMSLAQLDGAVSPSASSSAPVHVPSSTFAPDPNADEALGENAEEQAAASSSEAAVQQVETVAAQQAAPAAPAPVTASAHSPAPSVAATVFKQHNSLLFGAKVEVSGCEELVHTDASLPLEEVQNNFELTGGAWEEVMYEVYDALPEEEQKDVLLLVKDAVCLIKDDEMHDCRQALHASGHDAQSLGEAQTKRAKASLDWVDALSQVNSQWATIADEISLTDLPPAQSAAAFGYIHNMLCRHDDGE